MNERRKFSPEFKARMVLEALSGSKCNAELCREHGHKLQLLSDWKAAFLERAATVFRSEEQRSEAAARIAEPERRAGKPALKNEII
jgi:transposase-like protein